MSILLELDSLKNNSIYALEITFESEIPFCLKPLYKMIDRIYVPNNPYYKITTDINKIILLKTDIEHNYITGGISAGGISSREITLKALAYFKSANIYNSDDENNDIILNFDFDTENYFDQNKINITRHSLTHYQTFSENIHFIRGTRIPNKIILELNNFCNKIVFYSIPKEKNSFLTETVVNTFPVSTSIIDYTLKYFQNSQENKIKPDSNIGSILANPINYIKIDYISNQEINSGELYKIFTNSITPVNINSINIIYPITNLSKDLSFLRRLFKNYDVDNYNIMFAIYTD